MYSQKFRHTFSFNWVWFTLNYSKIAFFKWLLKPYVMCIYLWYSHRLLLALIWVHSTVGLTMMFLFCFGRAQSGQRGGDSLWLQLHPGRLHRSHELTGQQPQTGFWESQLVLIGKYNPGEGRTVRIGGHRYSRTEITVFTVSLHCFRQMESIYMTVYTKVPYLHVHQKFQSDVLSWC